jgi:flagellar biogenesis protein FliO
MLGSLIAVAVALAFIGFLFWIVLRIAFNGVPLAERESQ